ncbi:MAG: hypothetical protein K9L30_01300 [Desulfobacterales bacterium]|nr:hypothetical protein [Desulfobacterales bacterium]
MNKFYILIMRVILGAVFGVVLTRMFYPDVAIYYSAGLGIFLVLMAYLMEAWRNSKKGKGNKSR